LAFIEMAERIIERHRTIALALRDCEHRVSARCWMGVDDLAIVTEKRSAVSVSNPTS